MTAERSWQLYPDGRLVVDGEGEFLVHPNLPEWAVAANMRRAVNRSDQPDRAFVLSITDRCNIKCEFCCHPAGKAEISDADAERLVSEAACQDFDEICLTGGEPFLRLDTIVKLARITRANEKLLGIISNGSWAAEREQAFALAQRLSDAGVTRMSISWDPGHGRFVLPETAQNAVDACMEAGMRVCLTGSFMDPGDNHANYGIDVSQYSRYRNFVLHAFPVRAVGRGAGLEVAEGPPTAPDALNCPTDRLELVVYAQDGLTMPCCSLHAGYKIPSLSIGDWRTRPVSELMELHDGDPYFRMIAPKGGFKAVYAVVATEDPELFATLAPLDEFSDGCDACAHLMAPDRGPRVRRAIVAHVVRHLRAALKMAG